MDSAHRRVELQSGADLTYLVANVRRAARQKIDLHLPPSAAPEGGEDVLRRRVEELVDEYIRNTFAGARHGVSVNGMESKEAEEAVTEEFEPIDSRLVDKIRALEAQKESLAEKVADLRRTAPRRAARAYEAAALEESEEDERRRRRRDEEAVGRAADEVRLDVGVVDDVDRWEDVQAMWERGTQGLVELKGGLTETVARLERAEKVVEYLEGRGGRL